VEFIFENQYLLSKEFYNEFLMYSYFKKPPLLYLNLLLIVGFMIAIILLITGNTNNAFSSCIIVVPLLWIINLIRFVRAKKLSIGRDLETNNGRPHEVKFVVTNEGMGYHDISTGSNIEIGFSLIEKVYVTKNYYVLVTNTKQCWTFKKDSFSKGSPKDFLAFIASKGIRC
jgi:hypothetical protein